MKTKLIVKNMSTARRIMNLNKYEGAALDLYNFRRDVRKGYVNESLIIDTENNVYTQRQAIECKIPNKSKTYISVDYLIDTLFEIIRGLYTEDNNSDEYIYEKCEFILDEAELKVFQRLNTYLEMCDIVDDIIRKLNKGWYPEDSWKNIYNGKVDNDSFDANGYVDSEVILYDLDRALSDIRI